MGVVVGGKSSLMFRVFPIFIGVMVAVVFAITIFGFIYTGYNNATNRLCEYDMYQIGQSVARVKVTYRYNCLPYQKHNVLYTNGKEVK